MKNLSELKEMTLRVNDEHFPGWVWQNYDPDSHGSIDWFTNQLMIMYWTGCLSGEAGELGNAAKKYLRSVLGWGGKKLTRKEFQEVAELEIGDIFIYLVLTCEVLGLDMEEAVTKTLEKNFNRFGILGEDPRLG